MGNPQEAIALPVELERRVRRLASELGATPAQIMIDAIEEYVADQEDGRLAKERLEALDAGESETVSLETLMSEYGMAH